MNDWINWYGGECPVKGGATVDLKLKGSSAVYYHQIAGHCNWEHQGVVYDIAAYRLCACNSTQEEEPLTIEQLLTKANKHAKKAAKHEEKRLALIEKAKELLPEGYELNVLGEVVEAEIAEDMTDPNNWQAGDVVECVNSVPFYTEGRTYTLTPWDHNGKALSDSGEILAVDNMKDLYYSSASNFKWISRPNKETN